MLKNTNKFNINLFVRIFVCMIFFSYAPVSYSASPKETFDKGVSKISNAKSLTADFSGTVSGQTVKGKIYSKGKKFAIVSNATSNWYNGTDLYTYNPSSSETYVFKPTTEELGEVNPLLYLKSSSDYKVTGSKTKKQGVESFVLLPQKKGSGIKSVSVELDSKTFLPKKITVSMSSGGSVSISVSNIKLNTEISDSQFEYPKSKYKDAKIIDMR